jgi:nucleotide-binding universal stress UspA family protein
VRPLQTIVVPFDFSVHVDRALEYASALARAFGARVHLVHSMHLPPDVRMTGEWWATLRARSVRGLDECIDKLEAAGVPAEIHFSDEHPVTAIIELAEKLDADLIVMGSRGRSGLPHVLLGSVAERTIRLAPCPVLTVKAYNQE